MSRRFFFINTQTGCCIHARAAALASAGNGCSFHATRRRHRARIRQPAKRAACSRLLPPVKAPRRSSMTSRFRAHPAAILRWTPQATHRRAGPRSPKPAGGIVPPPRTPPAGGASPRSPPAASPWEGALRGLLAPRLKARASLRPRELCVPCRLGRTRRALELPLQT